MSSRNTNYGQATKNYIYEKFDHKCGYCGKEIVRGIDATIDHIDPTGLDHFDNYIAACKSCNSSKGTKSLHEFRRYCELQPLKEILAKLKFTTPQLDWLERQKWFPAKVPSHKFFYEIKDDES